MTMVPSEIAGSVMKTSLVSSCKPLQSVCLGSDCHTCIFSEVHVTMVPSEIAGSVMKRTSGSSLAESSCHTFKSTSICSQNTRSIARVASLSSKAKKGKSGKKQRHRENRKKAKLKHLELPATRDTTRGLEEVTSSGKKLYIGGISTELLPSNLPQDSMRWSVQEHLEPYLNTRGLGCRAGPLYTLLPRDWIRECFPNTGKYFRLFMKILELHPRLDPRGQNKVPVYDEGAPETYVVVGATAKRSGRGLRLADRHLSEVQFLNERDLLQKYFRAVAHAATAFLDTPSIRYLNTVKEMTKFSNFSFDPSDDSLIWPSLAVAANVVMEMHTDQDFVMGCAGAIGGKGFKPHDPNGSDILQYFCFPTTGAAIGLRNGDLLLFNPTIPHCVSSRATMGEDVICTSFYLKTAVVGGNDNSLAIVPNQETL